MYQCCRGFGKGNAKGNWFDIWYITDQNNIFLLESHWITVILQESEKFHSMDLQKHLSFQDKPGTCPRRIMVPDRDSSIGMQNYMLSQSAICNFLPFSVTVHSSSHHWEANPVMWYDITAIWNKKNNPSQSQDRFPDDSVWHSSPVELPLTHKPLMPVPPLYPRWKVGHDLCIIR